MEVKKNSVSFITNLARKVGSFSDTETGNGTDCKLKQLVQVRGVGYSSALRLAMTARRLCNMNRRACDAIKDPFKVYLISTTQYYICIKSKNIIEC